MEFFLGFYVSLPDSTLKVRFMFFIPRYRYTIVSSRSVLVVLFIPCLDRKKEKRGCKVVNQKNLDNYISSKKIFLCR